MKKLPWISLLLGAVACGGSPEPPPKTAPEPAPVVADPTPEPEPEPATEEAEPETVEPSMPPHEPDRPPCHTLEQSRCAISPGCAWYEKGGKGECKDE